jgi:hypothetical protein
LLARISHHGRTPDGAAFEQGTNMPRIPTFSIVLILATLMLGGCALPYMDPPIFATCDTLDCSAQESWRIS